MLRTVKKTVTANLRPKKHTQKMSGIIWPKICYNCFLTLSRFLQPEEDTREWDMKHCRRRRDYTPTDHGMTALYLIILS